ncbi:hypothetical protein P7K49_003235, partial [Saguinus oedipus]
MHETVNGKRSHTFKLMHARIALCDRHRVIARPLTMATSARLSDPALNSQGGTEG